MLIALSISVFGVPGDTIPVVPGEMDGGPVVTSKTVRQLDGGRGPDTISE